MVNKFLFLIFIIIFVLIGYNYLSKNNFSLSETVNYSSSPEEIKLIEKSKSLFPNDKEAQEKWIKDQVIYNGLIEKESSKISKLEITQKLIKESKKLFPENAEKQYLYLTEKFLSINAIELILNSEYIDTPTFELIKKLSYEYSNDIQKSADYAQRLSSIIYNARKLNLVLQSKEYGDLYEAFFLEFPKDPVRAYEKLERNVNARVSFNDMEIPPQYEGAKEYFEKIYSEYEMQLIALKSLFENDIDAIDSNLINLPKEYDLWKKTDNKFANEIIKDSFYYYTYKGKKYIAVYVSFSKNDYGFLVPSNSINDKLDDIELHRDDEVIKCTPKKILLSYGLIYVIPKQKPKGKPLSTGSSNVRGNLTLFGINPFDKIVVMEIVPYRVTENEIFLYKLNPSIMYSQLSMIFDINSKNLIAIKCGGKTYPSLNKESLLYSEIEEIIKKSPNIFPNLRNNIEKIESSFSTKTLNSNFVLTKIFYKSADISPKDIIFSEQLKKITLSNKVLLKALAKNKYSEFISEQMQKYNPKIAKVAMIRKNGFLNGKNIPKENFIHIYKSYLKAVEIEISQDIYKWENEIVPSIFSYEYEKQIILKKALLNTIKDAYLKNETDENFIHTDLKKRLR